MKTSPNDIRIALERKIVRKLIRMMRHAGWMPYKVDDGGDKLISVTTEAEILDAVFAVDEARIKFYDGKCIHNVLVVLGNEYDVICDWSYNETDNFNSVMEAHGAYTNKLEEAKA